MEMEWKEIKRDFNDKWNILGCYGAIDGKHTAMRAAANCESTFYSYKKSNNTVLMAVVGPNYQFIYNEVGSNSSLSDGGVFRNYSLFEVLENGLLPNNGVIVGDDAFFIKTYLMKSFPGANQAYDDKIYNYRLSRASRISENGFGILVSQFRVFEKTIACNVTTVDKILRTACALHNWLTNNAMETYLPRGSVHTEDMDRSEIIPGSWRSEVHGMVDIKRFGSNHHSQQAKAIREVYKQYFINEGRVS
jgi:hypothetical protein